MPAVVERRSGHALHSVAVRSAGRCRSTRRSASRTTSASGGYHAPAVRCATVGCALRVGVPRVLASSRRANVEEMFGGSTPPSAAAKKAGVCRTTAGSSWDFEDVRDFYVRALFGSDPTEKRHADPDVGTRPRRRRAVAEVIERGDDGVAAPRLALRGWDRAVVAATSGPGAGWGLVDHSAVLQGAGGTPCDACSTRSRCSSPTGARRAATSTS